MVTHSIAFLLALLPGSAWLLAPLPSIVGFAGGCATWSVGWGALEYILHRQDHDRTESRHMAHHRSPNDPTLRDVDLNTLWRRAGFYIMAVWMYAGFWVAMGNVFGLVLYYTNYEKIHQLTHYDMCEPQDNSDIDVIFENSDWLSVMVTWHKKHHNAWGVNFGVTTPFWDIIEGTASAKLLPQLRKRAEELHINYLFFPAVYTTHRDSTESPVCEASDANGKEVKMD